MAPVSRRRGLWEWLPSCCWPLAASPSLNSQLSAVVTFDSWWRDTFSPWSLDLLLRSLSGAVDGLGGGMSGGDIEGNASACPRVVC